MEKKVVQMLLTMVFQMLSIVINNEADIVYCLVPLLELKGKTHWQWLVELVSSVNKL